MTNGPAPVPYERDDTGRRYARARALAGDALEAWRTAVAPHLPARSTLRVLDLGAGTGIFSRAWTHWVDGRVVALEPAIGMRAELARATAGVAGVLVVAGVAERLPVRDGAVDVAWLSAVVHHLRDPEAAAGELGRVVRTGGVVLVRGLFAELGEPAPLRWLPGADRVRAAFPSVATVREPLLRHGFAAVAVHEVVEPGPATVGGVIERLRVMRPVDSLYGRFADEEFAAGLEAMAQLGPEAPSPPSTLGLLVLRRVDAGPGFAGPGAPAGR